MRNVKILIATIFQNAGDATRAIEIAKVLRDSAPEGIIPEITFVSRGSRFEQAQGMKDFRSMRQARGLRVFNTKKTFDPSLASLSETLLLPSSLLRVK